MRLLMVSLCILIMSSAAYADEFFINSDIEELHIIAIDNDQGQAMLKGPDSYEANVGIGDTVGADGGVVIEIDELFITIQVGDTNTRIPAKHAVGKSAGTQ